MRRPADVIDGVARALRPGGRFVGEFGGKGCVAKITAALDRALARRGLSARELSPWYFPSAEEYRAQLESRGFRVDEIALFPRPTPLPGDVVGWLETFAESFTRAVPASERLAFLEEVRDSLRPELVDANGVWIADYVRLRFRATLPA
jgi:hypothetical protein